MCFTFSCSPFAAEAHRLCPFLGYEFLPLPNAEEVLLDFPYDLHRLRSAVNRPPCFLEESHVNRALVGNDLFQKRGGLCFRELVEEVGINEDFHFFKNFRDALHSQCIQFLPNHMSFDEGIIILVVDLFVRKSNSLEKNDGWMRQKESGPYQKDREKRKKRKKKTKMNGKGMVLGMKRE